MLARYLKVYRRTLALVIIIVALVVVSSLTAGNVSKITSTLAGIGMIYGGISFIIWIVKTPVKKSKDEV